MTPQLFASFTFSNMFNILAKFIPMLIPLFRKTSAIAVATLILGHSQKGWILNLIKVIRKPNRKNLEMETYTPLPNNIIGQSQWTLQVSLKLGTGAKLCVI
jgi:hypothetical protein